MSNVAPPADPVASQYERWIYPPPCHDLSTLDFNSFACAFTALRDRYWAYWPDQPRRENLDILVAGCGTLAAAALAHLYPKTRVLGIDISSASLAHEQVLKDKYKLANLELLKCPVEDAASLGRDFDFIACHGVLHHMADPLAGLRALKAVLRPNGVAALMLYATYGRAGVYMFQELFRLLALEQRPEDVTIVKEALTMVSPPHAIRSYMQMAAKDLSSDAGLVDTFLHKRDKAFSVADCLDLIRDAGLVFQGWEENALYYPDAQIPAGSRFRAELEKLSEPQLWKAMELFYGRIPGHFFFVCHPERPQSSYRIHFDDDDFLKYMPVLRITSNRPADPLHAIPAEIRRAPFPPVTLNQVGSRILGQVDGHRSVEQIIAAAGLEGTRQQQLELARMFFRTLWRFGYSVYRLPPGSTDWRGTGA